jgi:hypothetical protein
VSDPEFTRPTITCLTPTDQYCAQPDTEDAFLRIMLADEAMPAIHPARCRASAAFAETASTDSALH